jgi:hypothetical protein
MNAQRLNDIYTNIHIAEKSDIENIRQLTLDYPFYHLPYVVLAKYYYDTSHYKFEDMLRQAAMRVKDRRQLYHYIHGNATNNSGTSFDPDTLKFEGRESETAVPEPFAIARDLIEEGSPLEVAGVEIETGSVVESNVPKAGLSDFLGDMEETPETDSRPEEFVFEGRHEDVNLANIEVDNELTGEEVLTEFFFSKSFTPEPVIAEETNTAIEQDVITEQEPIVIHPSAEDLVAFNGKMLDGAGMPGELTLTEETVATTDQVDEDMPVEVIQDTVSMDSGIENHAGEQKGTEKQVPAENDAPSPGQDFFAWLQHPQYTKVKMDVSMEEEAEKRDHKIDIIERFINVNPQISRPKKEFFNPENMAKRSEVVDLEYVTETLANIYLEQGNIDLAVKAYEKLSLQNPSKQAYFASLIEKIKKERK